MKITKITLGLERKISSPVNQYENFTPSIFMEANLEKGEKVDSVICDLKTIINGEMEEFIEDENKKSRR